MIHMTVDGLVKAAVLVLLIKYGVSKASYEPPKSLDTASE